MKIIVFGGNGRLGWLIVQKAINEGHKVTVFDLTRPNLPFTHPNLRIIEGSIYKPKTVAAAIRGHQIVISALGSHRKESRFVCRDGMRVIVLAMKHFRINRLIAVSAYGANEQIKASLYARLIRLVLPIHMQDKDKMEDLITASRTNWTILRPAMYLNFWPRKHYRMQPTIQRILPVVTRQAVANAIVDKLLTDRRYYGTKPAIFAD